MTNGERDIRNFLEHTTVRLTLVFYANAQIP
jgi:hypothetical protein